MILEILLLLLILYSIFISYLVLASLRRINQFESVIIKLQQIIEYSTERLKIVDADGHYESDDETDFFFKQLKDIQQVLDSLFEKE